MRYKIDDIVTLIMDYRGKTPKKLGMDWTENSRDILAISAKNIKNGRLINKDKAHYGDENLYKKWMKDGDIKVGDILMTSEAPLGESYLITKPLKAILSQRTFLIRLNKELADPWFFYSLIQSPMFKMKLLAKATGTTVIGIKQKELRKIIVDLPSLNIQKKIGYYFKVIDQKIRLNNQINDNLISQLKIISNSYFSYFEAYNGKIPLDWSYIKLVDIANIDAGYSYTSKELVDSNIAMATIKNFDRTGGFNIRGFKEIKPNKIVKKEKYAKLFDILVAHTDLTQNADIIGNAEPILNTSKYSKIIYSMDLVKVTPKAEKISPFLLALLLQGDRLKKHCLGYVNGTTVLHLSKKALKEFEFPFPTSFSDLDNIAKFAERNYKLISNNMKENQKLQNLKQVLLSKYF